MCNLFADNQLLRAMVAPFAATSSFSMARECAGDVAGMRAFLDPKACLRCEREFFGILVFFNLPFVLVKLSVGHFRQEFGGDGIGQPDAVGREEELKALGVHLCGGDMKNNGLATAGTDLTGRLDVF